MGHVVNVDALVKVDAAAQGFVTVISDKGVIVVASVWEAFQLYILFLFF